MARGDTVEDGDDDGPLSFESIEPIGVGEEAARPPRRGGMEGDEARSRHHKLEGVSRWLRWLRWLFPSGAIEFLAT